MSQPTEDDDMRLIVASCDAYMADEASPSDAFYDACIRHDAVLRRTVKFLRMAGADEQLMPPRSLRAAASYLLSN